MWTLTAEPRWRVVSYLQSSNTIIKGGDWERGEESGERILLVADGVSSSLDGAVEVGVIDGEGEADLSCKNGEEGFEWV